MTKFIFSSLLILILSCKMAFGATFYEIGMKYYNQNKLPEAEKYFYKAVKKHPSDDNARFYHAISLMRQSQYIEAEREFKRLYNSDNPNIVSAAKENIDIINKNRKKEKKSSSDYSKSNKNYIDYAFSNSTVMRWADFDMPIKVYTDRKQSLVKKAFGEWSKASNYKIKWTLVSNKNNADITIDFVSTKETTKKKTYQEGVAKYSYNSRGYLQHVDIEVLTRKPSNGVVYDSKKLYQTTLHEIGHALGIAGHSTYKTDVMSPVSNYTSSSLTFRDRNTIMILYKLQAGNAYAGYNTVVLEKYL